MVCVMMITFYHSDLGRTVRIRHFIKGCRKTNSDSQILNTFRHRYTNELIVSGKNS